MAPLTPFTNAKGESYLNQYDFTPQAYTRTQPVQGWVQEAIANAVHSVDPELQIRVTSGGQPSSRDPARKGAANGWLGSERHNEGQAADFALVRNGEVLPISANKSIYQSVARNLAAQGVPGIGVDTNANFIHAGGGSEAAWGYQGKSNGARYLDPDFATSIQEGRSMAQSGGIPRPPGLVTSPPGSGVASLQDTRTPTLPPPVPAAASPDMTLMRSQRPPTGLIADSFAGIPQPRRTTQSPAADLSAMGISNTTPRLTQDGQGVTDPADIVMFGKNPDYQSIGRLPTVPAPRTPMPSGVGQSYAGQERTGPLTRPTPVAPPPVRVASILPMPLPSWRVPIPTTAQIEGATGFRGPQTPMPPMPTPRPRRAPVPMPLSMRPQQQRAPLRITVQRDQPQQQQSRSTPQGFTESGNGRLTSNEYGDTYYSRHL